MLHCSLIPLHSLIMDGNYPNNMEISDYNSSSASFFGSSYSRESNFEVSDFLEFDDHWVKDDQTFMASGYNTIQSPHQEASQFISPSGSSSQQHANIANNTTGDGGSSGRERRENREKVAFKTKSEVEILDDGFKWRKYGKKMVKNSPNPRNYYRCSVEGCPVKKRVERDKEDPRYVITTYEGVHNHQGPPQF